MDTVYIACVLVGSEKSAPSVRDHHCVMNWIYGKMVKDPAGDRRIRDLSCAEQTAEDALLGIQRTEYVVSGKPDIVLLVNRDAVNLF